MNKHNHLWTITGATLMSFGLGIACIGLGDAVAPVVAQAATKTVRIKIKNNTKGRVSSNYDGSSSYAIYDGDTLHGVIQQHPDDKANSTVIMQKADGKYVVGTGGTDVPDEDDDLIVIKQSALIAKGKSTTFTANKRQVHVKVGVDGSMTISRTPTKKFPQADRVYVTADNTIHNYIDTRTAVSGLTTSTEFINSSRWLATIDQKWPNKERTTFTWQKKFTNGQLTIKNVKGKVLTTKAGLNSRATTTAKTTGAAWAFTFDHKAYQVSELRRLNQAKTGTSYVQLLDPDTGELAYTNVTTVKKNRVIKEVLVQSFSSIRNLVELKKIVGS
ncbi:hypothetical protein [Levilactobacillus brevis]|uniref:hypothetical protein n=1 Tax=Levilactobacillus brevis TaxID=1580 RepID=UPI000B405FFB|nr:hypothetical protein [Levilactobacillus brevis]